jgi:hypothetical protein
MADDKCRTTQDVGNIVALEHVNVKIPDQQLATLFYVVGLGLTRDPYLMTGLENMWVNAGQQQFHLPTGTPQVVRGDVGLVIPDFDELPGRLAMVKARLGATQFAYSVEDKHVRVVSPWGNVIRCHPPGPSFGDMTLGMPYVEFAVEQGVADGIARFYRDGLGAPAVVARNGGSGVARVTVGPHQELIFRETPEAIPPYDGHHIQIYITSPPAPMAAERASSPGRAAVPVPVPGHHRRHQPGALTIFTRSGVSAARSTSVRWSTGTSPSGSPPTSAGATPSCPE